MNCDLATTGPGGAMGLLVVLAITALVTGVALVVIARRRGDRARGMTGGVLLVLVLGASIALAPADSAEAREGGTPCSSGENSLTVTQTSSMEGLAPGIEPRAITGLVVNSGVDATRITTVEVRITAVTDRSGAPIETCDATDLTLVDALMPVGVTLEPGGSAPFSGATIGFADRPTNQDACRNAVIHLLYTANPR